MIKKFQLCLLFLTMLISIQSFCMDNPEMIDHVPTDIKQKILTLCTLPDAAAFFSTSKKNYYTYGENVAPIDAFLRENPRICYFLTENQHIGAFMHYTEKNNEKMYQFLTSYEHDDLKNKRLEMLELFGFTQDGRVENTFRTNQAAFKVFFRAKPRLLLAHDNPIGQALAKDLMYVIKVCIKNRIAINNVISTGYEHITFLLYAIARHDVNLVETLIKCGADVNLKGTCDKSPLLKAVWCAHFKCTVGQLLQATWYPDIKIVELLLQNGADPNQPNENYFSPLNYCKPGSPIRKLLVEYGGRRDFETVMEDLKWEYYYDFCDYFHIMP